MNVFCKWFDRLTQIAGLSILILSITAVPLLYFFKFLGIPGGFAHDFIMYVGISAFSCFLG